MKLLLLGMKKILPYLLIFLITASLFFWLQAAKTLGDGDPFYHAKITELILQQKGPVTDFPWLPLTTLKNNYADHHFLFHLYLIPFILIFKNPLIAIKIATVLLTAVFFTLFYWLLKKLNIKYAFIYTLLPLTSSALLTRLAIAKAQASSLIILIFIIFALIKQKKWLLFILAFLYVWTHGGWPTILIAAITYVLAVSIQKTLDSTELIKIEINQRLSTAKTRGKKPASTRQSSLGGHIFCLLICLKYLSKNFFTKNNLAWLGVCSLGLILGLIINPFFPQNLGFYWVQTFKVAIVNYQGKIGVGAEWLPYDPLTIIRGQTLLFVLWIFSVCWLIVNYKKSTRDQQLKVSQLFLLIFSLLFFIYTIKSRRMAEYFIPLAAISTALNFNPDLSQVSWSNLFIKLKSWLFNTKALIVLVIFLAILLASLSALINSKVQLYQGMKNFFATKVPAFDNFKGIAQWLKNNTPTKSIVFHSSWDYFPMLFYYDDQNYYINGLDSTFFYEQNPDLYNLWREIIEGKNIHNLSQVIPEKFHSNFIVVDKDHCDFDKILSADSNFVQVYQDKDGKIYKIVNSSHAAH